MRSSLVLALLLALRLAVRLLLLPLLLADDRAVVELLEDPPVPIVLTGAMVPFAFGSSDGLFNLGSALSLVQVLTPGVYVAMNGRWFTWDAIRAGLRLAMMWRPRCCGEPDFRVQYLPGPAQQ